MQGPGYPSNLFLSKAFGSKSRSETEQPIHRDNERALFSSLAIELGARVSRCSL